MNAHTHAIPDLDRKGLREFGLVTGAIVAALFGLLFPWLLDFKIPLWPWALAAILVIWALAAPQSLKPVYRLWMKLGLLLSRVTTPLILGAVFFLVILPMGLIMRLTRKDPMARKLDGKEKTYRVPSHKRGKESMERPY